MLVRLLRREKMDKWEKWEKWKKRVGNINTYRHHSYPFHIQGCKDPFG